MTWISLICFLALSSSAFGRSSYGSYSAQETLPRPLANQVPSSYGQQLPTPTLLPLEQQMISAPKVVPQLRGYGSGYQQQQQFQEQPVVVPLTEADILCRGKRPETVIPLEDGRRFVVCLDDGKGQEQQCPKALVFHPETRRCERRLGPLDNACTSQPCLNNGQCLPIDTSSFQCKCAPGYDGTTCELDARVCQTQQPCGQAPGTRCQSFRASAALSYICIHQNELAYGFNAQQVQPSPCRGLDGAQPLPITDKAFVMCDGERMFIESCPGGTVWDDINKACVWPDMRGIITDVKTPELKPTSYSQQIMTLPSTYGSQQQQQKPITKPIEFPTQSISSYGSEQLIRPELIKQQDFQTSSYGQQQIQRPELVRSEPIKQQDFKVSSYGQQTIQRPELIRPEVIEQEVFRAPSFGQQQIQRPELVRSEPIKQQDFQVSSYGQQSIQRPELIQQQQQTFRQPMQKQQEFRPVQQTSAY